MKLEAKSRLLAVAPLSLVRKYMGSFNRTRYAAIFNKYGSGNSQEKYRIYIPISGTMTPAKPVEVPPAITEYLSSL